MSGAGSPDLIIVGQITVDDVVPAAPGPWRRQIGGSSLYALAGARQWLDPGRIGLVARLGHDYPFDVERLLRDSGARHLALSRVPATHLIEWLIYEPDGSRRSLPRNPGLLEFAAEGSGSPAPYIEQLLAITPTADEIPAQWLPAAAIHLCTQASTRHRDALQALRGAARWISVDPSPHYSRSLGVAELARHLHGASAFLPSEQEVRALLAVSGPEALALELNRAGFPEVLIKRSAQPVVLAHAGVVHRVPVAPVAAVDPTGAGDSFCGAYAACRLLGHDPLESARRAVISAGRIVGCSGVKAALELTPEPR
jgi:ribokinase